MKRRTLGQHYLVDPSVISRMIDAADIRPSESVLEIGTGRGVLTERLVKLGAKYEGFEVDPENFRETISRVGLGESAVHNSDAFEARPTFDVLVSSLPYSRSQDFVEWIGQMKYDRAVVLLQEDFVRKVLSPPGNREYRAVSAIAQISCEMVEVERVPRAAFRPPPKVSSLLLSIRPRMRLTAAEIANVKRLFSLRRREVSSALSRLGFPEFGIGHRKRRVFQLTPEEVHAVCRGPEGSPI